jgi:hypothetical protein
LFLYNLVTYHWKGFKEGYNFAVVNISIKIHMQKLWSNKILNTFVPWWTCLSPRQFKPLLPMHMVALRSNLNSFFSWTWLFPKNFFIKLLLRPT